MRRIRIRGMKMIWVRNNFAQAYEAHWHYPLPAGFFDDNNAETNSGIRRSPPTMPVMNSVQKDAQEADEYVSELRKRHNRWNDTPEGGACAQRPSLLFMIPVLVSYFRNFEHIT